jgi:hypothetical protein
MKRNLATTLTAVFVLCGCLAQSLRADTTREPAPFPESPFQPDLTPGYVVIEGDIQIPLAQFQALTGGGIQAAGTFGPATLWPGGVVPFDFVTTGIGAVSSANQTAAINAMNAISARAGVVFRAAVAADGNRIRFQNSGFNNSPVGMVGGSQIINIVSWGSEIIICHEIYHSLGFQHEQSRLDRGNFVTINLANICGSGVSVGCTSGTAAGQCCLCVDNAGNCIPCNFNFGTVNNSFTYGPYDFDSFMHYGPTAFTCNGQNTITVNAPWDTQWQNAIGQRDHFSYYDADQLPRAVSVPERSLGSAGSLRSSVRHVPGSLPQLDACRCAGGNAVRRNVVREVRQQLRRRGQTHQERHHRRASRRCATRKLIL